MQIGTIGPVMSLQRALSGEGGSNRARGAGERDEEGVPFCVDLASAFIAEGSPDHAAMILKQGLVALAESLGKACRTLYVSEEERHRPPRKSVSHRRFSSA
jgi:hypothetical protein